MNKYQILQNILDALIDEAPSGFKKSYKKTPPELLDASRSLAYIHLFLKSKFGILEFKDRHDRITDGSNDGGIDAFYIDHDNRLLYLIQSKFRTDAENFTGKEINANELAAMDIDRIIDGEIHSESGSAYNGKIRKLQQLYSELPGKYKIKVIILANLTRLNTKAIKKLIDNHEFTIFDHAKTYNEIVFPICSGSFFDPEEVSIEIQTDSGSKADFYQYITTKYGEYSVRILFAPLLEIGKQLSRYKNSLLKYNPRNFLSLNNNPVNTEIANEIQNISSSNNFALLNNGITFVAASDEYQDKTGIKGISRLKIRKPQIINGGQTAFAIAKLLEKGHEKELDGKSVLIKVITPEEGKSLDVALIQAVSNANNRQSKIVEADRRSNDKQMLNIQNHIYEHYNMFFERKRGEFEEGINQKFISKDLIINRVEFIRSVFSFQGNAARSRTSQEIIFEEELFESILTPMGIDAMMLAYLAKRKLTSEKFKPGITYAVVAAYGSCLDKSKINNKNIDTLLGEIQLIKSDWDNFVQWAIAQTHNSKYVNNKQLKDNYFKAEQADKDIITYFKQKKYKFTYSLPLV